MPALFRRMGLVRPWLPWAHPWFFFIYTATIIYHLWCAANGLLGLDRRFDNLGALRLVNGAADRHWWALGNLVVGVGLWVNLHRPDFKYARRVLMLGLIWTGFRFLLIVPGRVMGDDIGNTLPNTLPNLFLCMAVHAAQLGESPVNPATAKRRP